MHGFSKEEVEAVASVLRLLNKKGNPLRSITITKLERSGESSVDIATIELSEGTVTVAYSEEWLNT